MTQQSHKLINQWPEIILIWYVRSSGVLVIVLMKKFTGLICIFCPQCNKDFGASKKEHQCARTIDITDSIGNEKRWVEKCVTQLHDSGLGVNLVTIDPDASAFKGAENAYRKTNSQSPPKHQMDTRPVRSNQCKLIKNTDFTKEMFGVRTHAERKYLRNRFANDLAARCTAEHKACMQHYCGNAIKVSNQMPAVRENIISIYAAPTKNYQVGI